RSMQRSIRQAFAADNTPLMSISGGTHHRMYDAIWRASLSLRQKTMYTTWQVILPLGVAQK
ncbi:MAG: hypothetical protein ACREPE_13690, partial [Lysobacter sp.]